ncbi:MAG: hypothetical protein A2Z94_03050 [Gallionellales bacterium GWA2_55_18]|nr:MAG: hypothetical protein A2Z94_03050 [Gallionellales bacterium GWA2_55_18]
MNHIYRLVWSEIANTWAAVAEIAKGRGKRSSTVGASPKPDEATVGWAMPTMPVLSLSKRLSFTQSYALLPLTLALAIIGAPAHALDVGALPTGGSVTAGSATISQVANILIVQQSSQRAAIDWKSFNIGASATVNFNQPNANAVALNRIGGNSASEIYGKLNANGQVFFSNPNGMLFARGAQVNVGGILATTMSLGNSDFMAGNYRLTNPGSGSIRNEGTINALGSVALIGNTTHNAGKIIATTVTLAAGNTVAIDLTADGLIRARVEDAALKASIENSGSIDGAQITLTAGQARETLDRVVNNSGIIRAIGLTMKGGEILLEGAIVENTGSIVASGANGGGQIKLMGDMAGGMVKVGGTLDASSLNGNGGFIETSAAHVQVADTARVTTLADNGINGIWLIDPFDFTIAATGGDMTGTAVSTALSGGNFSILSTSGGTGTLGDVNVNDVVTWSANKLTLNAQNNININANLNGSGSASLALEYGQASAWGGGNNTYNVNAAVNLPAGNNFSTKLGSAGSPAKNYTVITSLGAAGSVTAMDLQGMNGGLAANYALGSNIDATATSTWNFVSGTTYAGFLPVGTFTGNFDGLGHTLTWLTINRPATDNVGLFGYTNGTIRNVGLVGGSITGRNQVGGLAGLNGTGTITNSYSTGTVTGIGTTGYVGGLVGYNTATVVSSYSTGTVSSGSGNYVGGLVGGNASGSAAIYYSYSTGTVSGANNVGGLLGNNGGAIYSSYSTGTVSGSASNVGGLVGGNTGTITNSYSTGGVTGTSNVGGLVGMNAGGTVSNNFWDTITSGWATSAVGTGLTTTAMMTQATYPQAGGQWDFTNKWYMVEGSTRPILRMEYSTTISNAHQLQLIGMNLAANYTLANDLDLAAALANPNDIWGTASVAGVGGATLTVATGITSGFAPIGDVTTQFTGTFNGLNHTISNLAINRPAAGYVGLFGNIATGGTVSNLGLLTSNVIGSDFVGALAGTNNGNISNSYVSGGTVNGGNSDVGGLVGYNNGSISNSYSSGVTVGSNRYVGGLAGENSGTITDTYSSGGTVSGTSYFGGLVGANWNIVDTSYSTNAVAAGGSNGGGLIGWEEGFASNNNYWDVQASGRATSSGPETGLSTAQMTAMSNFTAAGWDIANTGGSGAVWRIYEGHSAPLLTSFLTPLTLADAPDVAVTYNGMAQSGASSMPDIGNFFGVAATGTNAGFYNGYYSNQQGYDLTGGNLTINPVALSAISLNGTRAYDGTTNVNANIFTLSGLVSGQDLTLSGVGILANPNVGANKPVTLNTLALGNGTNGLASNYTFTGGTQVATITPAPLTVTANAAGKTYDGFAYSGGNGVSYVGFVNGENSSVLSGTLGYGGTAQGAVNAGSYAITPTGLTANNYSLAYIDGTLTITAVPPPPVTTSTTTTTVTDAIASMIQTTVLAPTTMTTTMTTTTAPSGTTETQTTVSTTSSGTSTTTTTVTDAIVSMIQTITVANFVIRRPVEEIIQIDRPMGQALVCRKGG